MSEGPAPSVSVLRRMTVQSPGDIRKLVEAAETVVRLTAHQGNCRCSCGATDEFKDARTEFYRLWRRVKGEP